MYIFNIIIKIWVRKTYIVHFNLFHNFITTKLCASGDGSVCCRVLIYINSFKNAEVVTHTLPRQNTTNFNWFWEKYHLFSEPLLFKPMKISKWTQTDAYLQSYYKSIYVTISNFRKNVIFLHFWGLSNFQDLGPP